MTKDHPILAFIVDSPLQSWGHASRFQRRMTLAHPTRSGVIALLAAAAGIDKHGDDEAQILADRFSVLVLTAIRLPKPDRHRDGSPRMDREGNPRWLPAPRLIDYHTVGGGYDKQTESLSIPRKAERGGVFGTVVTQREYLADTRFAILLLGPRPLLEEAVANLSDPRWGLWLGRKSCPPATPIVGEIHSSEHDAWKWITARVGLPDSLSIDHCERWEEVGVDEQSHDDMLNDHPVAFGARAFAPRRIRHRRPNLP